MDKISFQFFPRSQGLNDKLQNAISVFESNSYKFSSDLHTFSSNEVLEAIRKDL